jgi:hypothetical protein
MTVRRAFGVIAALASVCLPTAVLAHGTANPPYLKPNAAEFTINDKWQGAKRITGVPQFAVPGLQVAADPPATVWATSCGAGQQEAVLRRSIELLGPPAHGRAYFSLTTDGIVPNSELKSLSLNVNGTRMYTRSKPFGSFSFDFPPALLKKLKVGANTFELRVVRPALPAGKKQCNVHGQKLYVAVTGKFQFDFATDLRVGVPKNKVEVRGSTTILVDQLVKNEGPDAAEGIEVMVS